jgi:hypothetical protein
MDQDSIINSFYYFLNNNDQEYYVNVDINVDQDFQINQNIINNAHFLRQTFELYNSTNSTVNSTSSNNNSSTVNSSSSTVNSNRNNINSNTNTINRSININRNTFLNFDRLMYIFGEFLDNQLEDFDNLEDVKVFLSKEEFDKIDSCILDESILMGKQCNICLEPVKISEKLKKLKCSHIFHELCLKPWLTTQSTKCPVCRLNTRET